MGEENNVAFTNRVDADVVFSVARVRQERFNDKVVKGSSNAVDLSNDWLEHQNTLILAFTDSHRLASAAIEHQQRGPCA